jgi:hypothetical protein
MKKMIPLLLLLASCSGGIIDRNIEIEIRNAATDKIDLKKDRYTRFFSSKPPLEIKLGLTGEEKGKIINAWYSLGLDQITGTTVISDNCHSMPKLYQVIHVMAGGGVQEISIDNGCDDFSFFDSGKAARIKKFIQLVRSIILSKPAVRNAPSSDVMYM